MALGQGLQPDSMNAVREALDRRSLGGNMGAMNQVTPESIVTDQTMPRVNSQTPSAMPSGATAQVGGGVDDSERMIIVKALISRLKRLSEPQQSAQGIL